jgi:WD40 repeat protein
MKPLKILLLCSIVAHSVAIANSAALKLARTIPLPGVKGRFDHFSIDTKAHLLFVAALGNNTLEVVDIAAGKHLKSIAGLRKPTGVLWLRNLNRIAVANGDDGTLRIYDGASYEWMKSIDSIDDADNVRFDPKAKLIYAGYGHGALAIIDESGMQQIGSIPLAAHPESFQLEQQGDRIFVNVPDAKQIAVINRKKKAVASIWPMGDFQANFPMALDEPNERLFIGCRNPAQLVVFNASTGMPVTHIAISGDTDDMFYDPRLKRLYLACGEGFIDVIDQNDADHYKIKERVATRSGARTCFFSTELNELYLAVPRDGGHSAEIRVFQPQK